MEIWMTMMTLGLTLAYKVLVELAFSFIKYLVACVERIGFKHK